MLCVGVVLFWVLVVLLFRCGLLAGWLSGFAALGGGSCGFDLRWDSLFECVFDLGEFCLGWWVCYFGYRFVCAVWGVVSVCWCSAFLLVDCGV